MSADEIIAELHVRVAIIKALARQTKSKQEERELTVASNILLSRRVRVVRSKDEPSLSLGRSAVNPISETTSALISTQITSITTSFSPFSPGLRGGATGIGGAGICAA